MIRFTGRALIATWRPYEQGGVSLTRTSQFESDHVTVFDQMVMAQHHDGFWATYPLVNCTVIWREKPAVVLIADEGQETVLPLAGKEDTLADKLQFGMRTPIHSMGSSDRNIEGAQEFAPQEGAQEK